MLYMLADYADQFGPLNVFRYLTFRTGGAVLTALLVSFIFGPFVIRWLKSAQANGQPIRDDGPANHLVAKQGTPTMGGFLILLGLAFGTLLWADLENHYVWATLVVTIGFGAIGFADDYLKVSRYSHRGLPGKIEARTRGCGRGCCDLVDHVRDARAIEYIARRTLFQRRPSRFELVLPAVRRARHGRRVQLRQPH